MSIRVHYYRGEEYGGCIDLPHNCSIGLAIESHRLRGWIEIMGVVFTDGNSRMINPDGYLCVIESDYVINKAPITVARVVTANG